MTIHSITIALARTTSSRSPVLSTLVGAVAATHASLVTRDDAAVSAQAILDVVAAVEFGTALR